MRRALRNLPCISWSVVITLAASATACLPSVVRTQEVDRSAVLDVEAELANAQELVVNTKYDQAIPLLQQLLEATKPDPARLERIYLLLIESYVYKANAPGVNEVYRNLSLDKGKDLVRECLSNEALRHTKPDPVRSPLEMLDLFDDVRQELFGTVVILSLDPPDAEVILSGERLNRGESGVWQADDVPAGTRTLVVRHPDRRTATLDLPVAAGERLVQSIKLEPKRGMGWYATRVALPVGVTGALVGILAASGSGDGSTAEPLSEPPPLPPPPTP